MNDLICGIFEISIVLQYDQIQKNQKSKKKKEKILFLFNTLNIVEVGFRKNNWKIDEPYFIDYSY